VAGFIQIIEFQTSRIDETRALIDELRSADIGSALRGTLTADRDRPGYYLQVVEFDSYESAMENSARPEISAFSARMAQLGDGPHRFYNLDVVDTWEADAVTSTAKKVIAGAAATAVAAGGVAAAVKSKQSDSGAGEYTAEGIDIETAAGPAPDTAVYTQVPDAEATTTAYPEATERPL
jgi:hypothetical protein